MDRANQDHRWLGSIDADMERSLATGELVRDALAYQIPQGRVDEIRDDSGGLLGRAPRRVRDLEHENACLRNQVAWCERELIARERRISELERGHETRGVWLFAIAMLLMVGAGGWIVAHI